jgi:tRNA (guanine-N7-)-methyltransferase
MTVPRQRRWPLEALKPYILEDTIAADQWDWRGVFHNEFPVEIEIGFGKGLFLINAAANAPQTNFLGIEIARKFQLLTATRLAKNGISNVRLIKADARLFLRDHVRSDSVRAIHVYFPDPWWKRRHIKRRLFTSNFVAQCERVLQRKGTLHIATDVSVYFEEMINLLQTARTMAPGSDQRILDSEHTTEYLTNFHRKFCLEGRQIFRATFERQD